MKGDPLPQAYSDEELPTMIRWLSGDMSVWFTNQDDEFKRLAATLAELAGLRTRLRDLTTAFEEEAYHRMSAECEVARLKGGGGVTIVMHEDGASRSLPGALKEEKDA